jgi:acyl-CoA synthetase (AMP-forming)/AMP-acid ligase II
MTLPDFEPTAPRLARRCAERFGERPFLLLGERRLGYAQAEAESARLARGLLASGVGKGTRVGILMPSGPDWAVAFLAATRIGALAVPINTFMKARELGWVLRHADVHTLLCWPRLLGHDYLERLEACAPGLARQRAGSLLLPELPYLRQVVAFGACDRPWALGPEALVGAADAAPGMDAGLLAAVETCVVPADPMVVIYSSGSTAEPKGAVHTHGSVIRQAWQLNTYRDIRADDVVWSPMPFFWVGGLVMGLVASMHVGCFLLCEEGFEPGATLALLERERATLVGGWPQYIQALESHPSLARRDLRSVRGGNFYAVLPPEKRPADPELRSNSLGMTETCGPHTMDDMEVELPEKQRGSFGRALPGVEHKIVDPETGAALPQGRFGEICVRGPTLMQGLYKVEREETFDADGFYHTGDGGYFDAEGHLYFKARLRELIKTGGANVTPREVELVAESYPEVQSCFVVGVPHPTRGQNVAAAVVVAPGQAITPEGLRERLRADLSAYKVPRHVYFYARDELPFTDSGKMDKRRLASLLASRIGGGDVPLRDRSAVA